MKKKTMTAKPALPAMTLNRSLSVLAQQLGYYVEVLRSAETKQQAVTAD